MSSNIASNPPNAGLAERKMQMIVRIAGLQDEQIFEYLESIILNATTQDFQLTEEETSVVENRLAHFQAHPEDFVTLEELTARLKKKA